jgi:broad specificity phosphatase PhoE
MLILIRHSLPEIIPTLPASQWHLSDEGRRRCRALADELAVYRPQVIVTSVEPKAVETGRLVADRLGLPCEVSPGLHEHERPEVVFGTREQFEASVAEFFVRPGALVFGAETAGQAHARFRRAVDDALAQYPERTVVIVTHGTVMTLFVAWANELEPFPFWQRLGLPAFVVLSRPDFVLESVAAHI